MRFDWRATSGPVLTLATALAALMSDGNLFVIANLAPLFVCIAALSAGISGVIPGLVCAAIAVAFTMLSTPAQDPAVFDATPHARIVILAITATGAAIITGLLRERMTDALVRQRERHATATRLRAALDQIEIGVVLLNADTRAEFINRAFRQTFSLPDAKADSRPPFIALMYHGRNTGAFEMPEDELANFVAERMRMVRAGDATPINLNLANGEVLRFSCTALPDGGRMLSYTPVTDLVRHTDRLSDADYLLSLRGRDRALANHLRAAE